MKNRYYNPELKERAVRLSYQRENIKELADELGIGVERIYKPCKAANSATLPKPENPMPDDALEVKRPRKALKEKELEQEILKKAVHIFSKSDGRSMDP
ncbi:transposase [Galbibacter sp. BG1]|uniref:transposase n=1 Tax=Galbibacter sp. BG1 TaxID=1170699 RepID=UPI0015BA6176|nr:transposase [Galbibacter sp. BG1]QLE02472.1 transposase [Galbibacter sp. BG1]